MSEHEQSQKLPVRLYQTDDQIMVAAPMPGLEPENISVTIAGDRVTIRGEERGPGQHDRDLLLAEWTIGPYERELTLPRPVSARLSNATYGNGVLVLSMPALAPGQAADRAEFQLQPIDSTRGERVGHMGREVIPHTTEEHREQQAATIRAAGEAE